MDIAPKEKVASKEYFEPRLSFILERKENGSPKTSFGSAKKAIG
jgi:hypothetical protein